MFLKFKRLLTIMMFVELGLLALLGILTTWWLPFVEVFLSFLCGALISRRYGLAARRLDTPESVFDATIGTIAAVLLMLPGMLTDLIGLILWFRPTRTLVGKRAVQWAQSHSNVAFGPQRVVPDGSGTIEAEVIDVRTMPDS